MMKTIFAAAMLAGLLGASAAIADPAPKCCPASAATATVAGRCNATPTATIATATGSRDRDRASPARFTPPVDAQDRKQPVCDTNGDNCR